MSSVNASFAKWTVANAAWCEAAARSFPSYNALMVMGSALAEGAPGSELRSIRDDERSAWSELQAARDENDKAAGLTTFYI